MSNIAIIIVHYNSTQETLECLQSLRKVNKTGHQVSIFVVDNGSKDPLEVPTKLLPPQTTILRSDANLGFTSGNNLGMRQALQTVQPDYLLLLNNDTTVDPNFLKELITCAEANPQAGMIAPKIYFSKGREYHADSYTEQQLGHVFWYAGGSIDWRNLDAFHRGVDELDRGHFDSQKTSDFATGCCVLIPKRVIDQIGGFDKRYFLYLEDVDLSMRVRAAGYSILFCKQAVIWHKNAGSTGGAGSAIQQYYQTRNRLFLFTKYGKARHHLTILKYALKLFLRGSMLERRAVLDWAIGRMGKQAVL